MPRTIVVKQSGELTVRLPVPFDERVIDSGLHELKEEFVDSNRRMFHVTIAICSQANVGIEEFKIQNLSYVSTNLDNCGCSLLSARVNCANCKVKI